MPYTNATFDPAVPAGSSQLSAGDDSVRTLKLDIKERLETLVVDFDDDPLEILPGVIAGLTPPHVGRKKIIPFSSFIYGRSDEVNIYNSNVAQSDDTGRSFFASVDLPHGSIIKEVEVIWNRAVNVSLQLEVFSVTFDAAVTRSSIVIVTETGAGIQLSSSGPLSYAITEDETIAIEVTPPSAGEIFLIYAVRITYDTPTP
jgi:hypothetical protein